jgi:urease accessory protein
MPPVLMMPVLLLLLDSRAPSGGHAHSSGMEPAVTAGLVRDIADVENFCRARLRTSGRVSAAFAAAACRLAAGLAGGRTDDRTDGLGAGRGSGRVVGRGADARTASPTTAAPWTAWEELDTELDARLPSEAVRAASRSLGNGLRRMVGAMFPDLPLPWPSAPAPHHPLVLGAAVALAGGDPALAAQAAALNSITTPASAAVRLLGLDPLAVQGMLARLATDVRPDSALWAVDEPQSLPADGAPYLDLLADVHRMSGVRLFAS